MIDKLNYTLLNPTFNDKPIEIDNPKYKNLIKDIDENSTNGRLKIGDKVWLSGNLCLKVAFRDDKRIGFLRD